MFFMKDAAQQALDVNIGRVLELFNRGILPGEEARQSLRHFFEGAAHEDADGLDNYLGQILKRVDSGALKLDRARQELVKAALASEKHDPKYANILQQMTA